MILPLLAALCAGGSVGLLTWVVLDRARHLRFEKREYKLRIPLLFKLGLPLAKKMEVLFEGPRWEPKLTRIDQKLTTAGVAQLYSPREFLGLCYVSAMVCAAVGVLFVALGHTLTLLMGILLILYGIAAPTLWLFSLTRQRHRSIRRALPNVLDLLTLSVEAGRDFFTALRDILQQREQDALGEELERVFREVQLGKARRESLRAMGKRVKQQDLDTVIETLVQADELGISIGQILRILSEQMRQKRFSYAEKQANEAPVKMLLPLFLFIFPAVIIVMLGPVALESLSGFAGF